jgi:hypothetical protein
MGTNKGMQKLNIAAPLLINNLVVLSVFATTIAPASAASIPIPSDPLEIAILVVILSILTFVVWLIQRIVRQAKGEPLKQPLSRARAERLGTLKKLYIACAMLFGLLFMGFGVFGAIQQREIEAAFNAKNVLTTATLSQPKVISDSKSKSQTYTATVSWKDEAGVQQSLLERPIPSALIEPRLIMNRLTKPEIEIRYFKVGERQMIKFVEQAKPTFGPTEIGLIGAALFLVGSVFAFLARRKTLVA